MENLNPTHFSEIVQRSGVSEAIVLLNFTSIDDPSEVDKLLNRNNDRRWKHWPHGPGWSVSGIDPQTGERTFLGVQFKPDTPVQKGTKKDGTPDYQKYFGATDYPAEPLFLEMPEADYWEKVLNDPSISVILGEGAKKAGAALTAGIATISLPGVSCGQKLEELKPRLKPFCGVGRKVYLGFDSDQNENPQVRKALDTLGRLISAEGAVVYVLQWDAQWKGLDDYIVAHGHEAISTLIDKAVTFAAWRKTGEQAKGKEKPERKTAADSLLNLARQAKYFHTSDKVAYADVWIEGNRHTYAVRSKAFRLWLQGQYYENHGKGIGAQTLQDTLGTLEAIAIFQGETREVQLRTAEHQGKIYLDLGMPDWKAVEVDAAGWRLISDPPVRFWRPDSLLPLPYPVEGGSLDELRELLNVDGAAWTLIITFLLFSFCPEKTYPVLVLSAHRGSGKTAAAEILKGLVDPGKAPLIKPQGDTHKLAVAASRRWLMVYDNVSHISPEQSDDFCRLATGFGYSTRTLHTTDEETTFELTRPQIITAIDALVTRDDLADRVLMVQLPEITEEMRLPQAELTAKTEAARPQILGALLAALSQTLAELPHTKPEKLPRMADYALFAMAAEKALGLTPGEFRATFDESREQSRQVVIESSPIGEAVMRLMRDRLIWKGTASDLLTELERHSEESTVKSRYWPKASNIFKRQLNRLAPDLKALGIDLHEIRAGHDRTRLLVLEKVVKISSLSSASDWKNSEPIQRKDSDADDTADDTADDKGNADDTADDKRDADDKRTIEKKGIVRNESLSQQGFLENADDADDKNTSFSSQSQKKRDSKPEVIVDADDF